MKENDISRATLGRIPIYLEHLKGLSSCPENISSTAIARELGFGEVQVRKDLGALCGKGRPKVGYKTETLIKCLEGYFETERTKAVLLGCGHFGRALLDFSGFDDLGLDISAGFDENILKAEKSAGGRPVLPMSDFAKFCGENEVSLGIINVPPEGAQDAFELLHENGIKAVWCMTPCRLSAPPDAVVEYENMVASSAYLKMQIDQRRTK